MAYRIEFAPEARDDLRELYLYIERKSDPNRAIAYIERIERFCLTFGEFPERGARRDDLLPGLRVVGFERRIAVAFGVGPGIVTFYRFLYGGRNLTSAFAGD